MNIITISREFGSGGLELGKRLLEYAQNWFRRKENRESNYPIILPIRDYFVL